jgi:hypothetical protein
VQQALTLTRQKQAKSLELRAAMSLVSGFLNMGVERSRLTRTPSLSVMIDMLPHRCAVLQVLRDDPVEQLRRDLSVPNIVRVDHDHRASRADEKAITPCLSDGIGGGLVNKCVNGIRRQLLGG